MQTVPRPAGPARPRRAIAVVSVHASPLGELGRGENGGMNLSVRRLCEGLAQRGIPSDVFVRRDDPDSPDEEMIAPGSRLVRLAAGPPGPLAKQEVLAWVPHFTRAVLDHARSESREYRLVHSHYWLSGWVARRLVQRWRVPWIHSFHTLARVKAEAGLPADALRAGVEAALVRGADRLVAMSPAEQADLVRLYGAEEDRVCVVPPGVDVDDAGPRRTAVLREQLGLQGRRVVLYAGRLERLKGVDVLLHAVHAIARDPRLDDTVAVLAGDDSGDGREQAGSSGGERRRLEALAGELGLEGRVRFVGAVPHDALADLYAIAAVCVVPSLTESFGLVALEAQAAGTPVVAAAVGGLRDVVDEGVTGVLVVGRDPAAYAASITALLQDPERRRRMGDAGRVRAAAFSWERATERLVSLYGCVEAPAPPGTPEACGCL